MDRLVARFINAALIYFVFGMTLGVVLIFWPKWPGVMGTVHAHVNLMGWLAMIVYAAGYALVPRFSGRPLYSPRMADFHFWLSNGAFVAVNVLWVVVAFQEPATLSYALFYSLLAISSVLMLISVLVFVLNMFKTMR